MALIGEIGSQVQAMARTEGAIAAEKAQLKQDGKAVTPQAIREQAYTTAYNQALSASGYGTGGAIQQGMQAATAALQGLAGGSLTTALAQGSAPYLAEVVKKTAPNEASRMMAHAVLGAVVAQASGNNALAGATGAAGGELAADVILKQLYPGKDASDLSEEQKQTVSALSTLAAGLAGGLAGDSTRSALAGAQAGQNATENNFLGGNEETQTKFAQEHGKDVLSCADDPSSESCQRGEAVNKALAGSMATGGVALLPGGAQAMWALGAGTNSVIQYAEDGKVNPVNAIISGWVNVASIGSRLVGTVSWNAGGGALTNTINGDDPLTGAITSGAGATLGYGTDKLISKGVNSVGKYLTDGFDPMRLKYEDVKGSLTISKEMLPHKLPAAMGNTGESIVSEFIAPKVQQIIDDKNSR